MLVHSTIWKYLIKIKWVGNGKGIAYGGVWSTWHFHIYDMTLSTEKLCTVAGVECKTGLRGIGFNPQLGCCFCAVARAVTLTTFSFFVFAPVKSWNPTKIYF